MCWKRRRQTLSSATESTPGILSPYHYFGCFDDTSIIRRSAVQMVVITSVIWSGRCNPEARPCDHSEMEGESTRKSNNCVLLHPRAARRVAKSFNKSGVPAGVYISETTADERQELLGKLANGDIHVLCTVDVFNEGADLPFVECLLFLRPTESKRIFYQQLGRGLRQYSGKTYCTVIDFIGNFHNAYKIVEYQNLLPFEESDLIPAFRYARTRKDILNLPLNCEVHFEEKVIKVFADQALDPRYATRHNIGRIMLYEYDRLRGHLGQTHPSEKLIVTYSRRPFFVRSLAAGQHLKH